MNGVVETLNDRERDFLTIRGQAGELEASRFQADRLSSPVQIAPGVRRQEWGVESSKVVGHEGQLAAMQRRRRDAHGQDRDADHG